MTVVRPTDEIDAIDKRAFEMAQAVLADASLRASLYPEAAKLASRLTELNQELEQRDPPAHKARAPQVSEATLDLLFVRFEIQMYSLRLNRLRRPM